MQITYKLIYFNTLQEKEAKSNSYTNVRFDYDSK